jgi:hypothetical protein
VLRIIGGKGRSTSKPKTDPGPKGVVFHTKNDSKGNRWNLGPFLGLGCGASTHSIDLRFPPKPDGEIVETRELLELKYYYDQLKELLESEG